MIDIDGIASEQEGVADSISSQRLRDIQSEIKNDIEKSLLSALVVPCALYDENGLLMFFNKAFTAEFECVDMFSSYDDFVNGFELLSPSERIDFPCDNESIKQDAFLPFNGHSYCLHSSIVRYKAERMILLSVQDLLERRGAIRLQRERHEELLLISRAMSVGEMATTLVHELNQPLGSIVNYLASANHLAEKTPECSDRLLQAIDLAAKQASQATAVVSRVRGFVKSRQPKRERCSINQLAEEAVELLQLELQKHHIRMACNFTSELPALCVDKVMIQQVIANLLRNAIDSLKAIAPKKRELTIESYRDSACRIVVKIIDNGKGISQTDEHHLFSPFFSARKEGMGAGLSICRSFIELHNGTLYFERNKVAGVSFVFELPVI